MMITAVKNEIKSVTTEKRREFLCRAVSPNRPKEVWRVINVCAIQVVVSDLLNLVDSLPDHCRLIFRQIEVALNQVIRK